MKKILAILLVMALMVPMATFASAAENTMTLKTTVPAASYTLSIPATMEVPFASEEVKFALPEVIESSGFQGRDLRIYISDMAAIGDDNYRLPMQIVANPDEEAPAIDLMEEKAMYFIFTDESGSLDNVCYVAEGGAVGQLDSMSLLFEKEDWYKLSPGEHTGFIEFTSEVVPNVMGE